MTYNPVLMRQAMRLAEKSRGLCSPNPFVGAIIVKDNTVIGEGSTQSYGSHHAEVMALKQAGDAAQNADMYVTLEPCSHYGKTPPCADAIIKAGIKAVFIGILDPNPLVAGNGIKRLQDSGVMVSTGHYEQEISRQLEYHICRVLKQRPFIIWKTALSLDGRYAAQDGSSRWISSAQSRRAVHKLRQEIDVILTGINTVRRDDPLLNSRLKKPKKQPLRVVLDPLLEISPESKIVQTANQLPTLIFCAEAGIDKTKYQDLMTRGIEIIPVTARSARLDLDKVLGFLHERGYYSVLLECGSELSSSFIKQGLVDKCLIHYGNKILGGDKSILDQLQIPNIDSALILKDLRLKKMGDGFLVSAYL
jgi:diaminohydroxyphosphoribosylaminopyrimidine deaminase/5-amino-6-(5-phosphoribosylamino)uracil reductase